jgi:hypothetical protein
MAYDKDDDNIISPYYDRDDEDDDDLEYDYYDEDDLP